MKNIIIIWIGIQLAVMGALSASDMNQAINGTINCNTKATISEYKTHKNSDLKLSILGAIFPLPFILPNSAVDQFVNNYCANK